MSAATAPLLVGVFPAAERERRARLLTALEEALPVRFEGRGDGDLRGLDAVLELGGGTQAKAATAAGLPALSLLVSEPAAAGGEAAQALSAVPELDRRLRGARLPDPRLGSALSSGARLPAERDAVLGSCGGEPTWIRAGSREAALLAPAELGADEALRERLCDGRSAALLPLVHFLAGLTAATRWRPPPTRASILFDDPNLHWPSYGFVRLGALGLHAREHGYHAALATVPLDSWFAHPAAVRALRQSRGAISLLVHGNDHFGDELGQLRTRAEAVALAAQALRRVEAFGRRTGVPVDKVMVPPHEECSAVTPAALRRCGFEAITMTRPFPWLAPPPRSWLARPVGSGPLAGWRPVDVADGLPVLLRHPFAVRSRAELALRAFLGQPLILYGHQADLHEGLGILEDAVADVGRLGPTRWCSLGAIAAGSYETRREGSRLAVRPLTRRVEVEIPPGIEQLSIAPAPAIPTAAAIVDGRSHSPEAPVDVAPGTTVTVELRAGDELDPASVPAPRRQSLAVPRRVLSEGRDRLAPLLARAR